MLILYWQNAGGSAKLKKPAVLAASIFPFTYFSNLVNGKNIASVWSKIEIKFTLRQYFFR